MVKFQLDNDLHIREFTAEDAQAVFETVVANRNHLSTFMHWMTPDYSIRSAKAFIEQSNEQREARKGLGFGIFRGEVFIGSIGFVKFDWAAGKTEIGYWISSDEQGKGIVTRSAEMLIDFGFRELELNRIEIRCSAENTRSAAIPKRLGFLLEGVLRRAEYRDGRLHDFEIYGLLASEWNGPVNL